jgi:hypothetical protein
MMRSQLVAIVPTVASCNNKTVAIISTGSKTAAISSRARKQVVRMEVRMEVDSKLADSKLAGFSRGCLEVDGKLADSKLSICIRIRGMESQTMEVVMLAMLAGKGVVQVTRTELDRKLVCLHRR